MLSYIVAVLALSMLVNVHGFTLSSQRIVMPRTTGKTTQSHLIENKYVSQKTSQLQMNFFEDAVRYFTNLNKEASAKHILIKV